MAYLLFMLFTPIQLTFIADRFQYAHDTYELDFFQRPSAQISDTMIR